MLVVRQTGPPERAGDKTGPPERASVFSWTDANKWDKTVKTDLIDDGLGMNVNVHVTKHSFVVSLLLLLNNNVHLSCAHQHPERSHDTY